MDDEEGIRDVMESLLDSLGYSPICVKDGNEALKTLFGNENRPTFSAIFLDLVIVGGMGGKEVVSEIRKIDKEIPVFVISGYSDDPVMKSPGNYGFTASLCKPFALAELKELINRFLK